MTTLEQHVKILRKLLYFRQSVVKFMRKDDIRFCGFESYPGEIQAILFAIKELEKNRRRKNIRRS